LHVAVREAYDIGEIIGRGASADVYMATDKKTREIYACKVVEMDKQMNDSNTMKMEANILLKVQHENVMSMHALYACEEEMWMVMEYANGGDLVHALATLPIYNEETVARYFKQILLAIQHLHVHHIVHRDIKLENVLFCQKKLDQGGKEKKEEDNDDDEEFMRVLKLTDFGLSAELTPATVGRTLKTLTTNSSMDNNSEQEELNYTNKTLTVLHEVIKTIILIYIHII